jgi:hypothetical protein
VLKKIVFSVSVIVALGFQSCSEPTHPDSDRLCNCYTEMRRADEDKLDAVTASCNAIYSDIIKSLENNAEEKAKFDEAYAACQ